MLGNFPPFTTMQELNLDWILTKIKNILRFVPDDGSVGQILRRTRSGAEWSDEQGAGGSVTSVNGMQGAVVLGAADVGALPDTYVAPVTSVNGMTGDVVISSGAVDSVNGQTGAVVLDAADVGALPDTYVAPVTSVNGQTGAVSLSIPDSTSDLVNDSGFVNAAGASAAAPVQSVNGQTGAVVIQTGSPLDAYPVGSLYMSVNSISPAVLFGGTWERLKDRFLLGAGDTYTAGDTGGEATHTLTVAEMPAHTHKSQGFWQTPDSGGHNAIARTMISTDPTDTNSLQNTGGDQPHNNMPPYLVVYMWKRTA